MARKAENETVNLMNYSTDLNKFLPRNMIEKQNKHFTLDYNLPISYLKAVKIRLFQMIFKTSAGGAGGGK